MHTHTAFSDCRLPCLWPVHAADNASQKKRHQSCQDPHEVFNVACNSRVWRAQPSNAVDQPSGIWFGQAKLSPFPWKRNKLRPTGWVIWIGSFWGVKLLFHWCWNFHFKEPHLLSWSISKLFFPRTWGWSQTGNEPEVLFPEGKPFVYISQLWKKKNWLTPHKHTHYTRNKNKKKAHYAKP